MDNTSKNVAPVFQNNLRQDNSMQAAILRTASRAINNVDWLWSTAKIWLRLAAYNVKNVKCWFHWAGNGQHWPISAPYPPTALCWPLSRHLMVMAWEYIPYRESILYTPVLEGECWHGWHIRHTPLAALCWPPMRHLPVTPCKHTLQIPDYLLWLILVVPVIPTW